MITPWWAVAAAELNEREAVPILRRAHERFQGEYGGDYRLELTHALRRLTGDDQVALVLDWFYQELPNPPQSTWAMSNMLQKLLDVEGRDRSPFARALVRHPRFEELNWKSLEILAKAMNASAGRPLISEQELEAVRPPLGTLDFFARDIPKAMAQFPRETGVFLSTLAKWRRALRESL